MKINAFIFDWSGVISDDRAPVYEANMQILRDYEKPTMTFEEWLPKTELTAVDFAIKQGIQEDPKIIDALYKKYFNEANEAGIVPKVYPDAHDVLEYLRGRDKIIAVLSSHPSQNLLREAERYGVRNFLKMIKGDTGNKIDGLRAMYADLQEEPEHCVYTGDTVFDIRAANAVGVHSAAVCQGYHIRERLESENPEIILETLSDIKKLDIE